MATTQFGTKLKWYLRKAKMQGYDLAERIGEHPSIISHFMTGRQLPKNEETVYNHLNAILTVFIDEQVLTTPKQLTELVTLAPFKKNQSGEATRKELLKQLKNRLKSAKTPVTPFEKPTYITATLVPLFSRDEDIPKEREVKSQLDGDGKKQYEAPEEIGLSVLNEYSLLKASINILDEYLTEANQTPLDTQQARVISIQIKKETLNIYKSLSPQARAVLGWLSVLPDRCSLHTVGMICTTKELSETDGLSAFDELSRCHLIELLDTTYPSEYIEDYLWKFRHPVIRNFARERVKDTEEEEPVKKRYLTYYYKLFRKFIFDKYGYGFDADLLETRPEFLRLSSEYAAFYNAMQEMSEVRQNYIKKEMIRLGIIRDEATYQWVLGLSKRSPNTLTDDENDIVEYYYHNVTELPECPYPLVEWFLKYLDYEMNPEYFYTPNAFAVLWGRLASIYSMMDTDALLYKVNINEPLSNFIVL